MAWPSCPHCGTRDLVDGKRAEEVTPAESIVCPASIRNTA